MHLVPSIRPALFHGIDELERLAHAAAGRAFAECGLDERESVLRQLQALDSDAFSMVSDFTYEAYYGHPTVLAAIEAETGWRGDGPITGSSMTPFDVAQLERVRKLPPSYRSVATTPEVKR